MSNREEGLVRLKLENINLRNQHYINLHYIIRDLRQSVSFAKGDFLDIGCGNKPYKELFSPAVKSYVGCDIIQSSENLVDVICPADRLAFEGEQFDTVLCTQVLEHVANHKGVIAETFRVLRPTGKAIFTVPFCWELHEEPYDFFRVSKHGLQYLFEEAGFKVELIKSNGGKWSTVFQLFLNALYSTRKYVTVRSRIIKLLFVRLRFVTLYNRFAVWLDDKYFDDNITLNYIVIATKPAK
jgi:SAM-dependent methyltransferase